MCRHTSASDLESCCVCGGSFRFACRPSGRRLFGVFLSLVRSAATLRSRVLYLLLIKVEAPPPFC